MFSCDTFLLEHSNGVFTLAETEAHNNNNSLFTLSIQIAFCLFTICLIVVATCNSPKQFVKMSCIELCGGFHTNHRDRCKFPLGVPPFYRHKVTPLPTAWATASSPLTAPCPDCPLPPAPFLSRLRSGTLNRFAQVTNALRIDHPFHNAPGYCEQFPNFCICAHLFCL